MIGGMRTADSWAPPLKLSALADRYGVDGAQLVDLADAVRDGIRGLGLEKCAGLLIAEQSNGQLDYLSPTRARRLALDLTCLWITTSPDAAGPRSSPPSCRPAGSAELVRTATADRPRPEAVPVTPTCLPVTRQGWPDESPGRGARRRRRSGRCSSWWAGLDVGVDEPAAATTPVRHQVEVVCLACARTATVADARTGAGRCRACGGTLVVNEVA